MAQTNTDYRSLVNVDELTDYVRHAAQDMQGFSQLANAPSGSGLGKGKGDTLVYVYYPNVADSAGELDENEEIPSTNLTPIRASMVLKEYGNSIRWTGKLEDLACIGPEDDFMIALVDDYRKLENSLCFDQCALSSWRASFAATNQFVTNGTLTTAATAGLTLANLRYLVTNAEKRLIPYFDGESYIIVSGPDNLDALNYDTDVRAYVQFEMGPDALNGEVSRIGKCRLVRDTHKVPKNGGSSTGNGALADRTYLIGADAVQKEVAVPVEIRFQDRDFGRNQSFAHYSIMVFKKILDQATHSKEHVIVSQSA